MICHVLMIAICKDIFCHVIFLSNYIVYEYKIPLLISEHNFDTFIIQLTIRIETFLFRYVYIRRTKANHQTPLQYRFQQYLFACTKS